MTIQELYERFSLVLIYEFLDESLVSKTTKKTPKIDEYPTIQSSQ